MLAIAEFIQYSVLKTTALHGFSLIREFQFAFMKLIENIMAPTVGSDGFKT